MPITKSAKKSLRQDRRRKALNDPTRVKIKEAVKKTLAHPTPGNIAQATSVVDRAAKRKIIHPNRAARLKSRLSRCLKKS